MAAVVAIPRPTGTFTVQRPGATVPADPVAGHASYRRGVDVRNPEGVQQQVGAWLLLLDPEAWPVSEVDTVVHVETGTTYRVHAAAFRPGGGHLDHVTIDADVTTADASDELGVDTDGNVEALPQDGG